MECLEITETVTPGDSTVDNTVELSGTDSGLSNLLPAEVQSCGWSKFGPWSECSLSCGGGLQIRLRQPSGDQADLVECKAARREARWCNPAPCPLTPPAVSTTTTTTTATTTTTTTTAALSFNLLQCIIQFISIYYIFYTR